MQCEMQSGTNVLQSFNLRESFSLPATLDLDEEKGVLRGVRALGLESKNGKRYSKAAVKGAIPLLENAKIFFDHAATDDDGNDLPRKFGDRFGRLKEVTQNEDGSASGSIHYNPRHARAAEFVWYARNDPSGIGLSIVGAGKGSTQSDGIKIVEQITHIASVDIVDGPATVMGLFEQETYKKVSDPQADAKAHATAAAAHAVAAQTAVAQAGTPTEGDAMDAGTSADAAGAAGAGDGSDTWRTKLAELAHTAVSDASLSKDDVLKKLKGICGLIEEDGGSDAGAVDDDATPEKCAEQLRTFLHPAVKWASKKIDEQFVAERRIELREQAKTAGVAEKSITPTFIDLLLKESTAAGIATLIEDRKSIAAPSGPSYAPRVAPATPGGDKRTAKEIADALFTQDDGGEG